MFDGEALAAAVRDYVAKATAPLVAQIAEQAARIKSLEVVPWRVICAQDTADAVARVPKPAEVDYGRIGQEIDAKVAALPVAKPEPVDYERIGKAIEEVVAGLPPAKPGEPGKDFDPTVIMELRESIGHLAKGQLGDSVLLKAIDADIAVLKDSIPEIAALKALPISPSSFMLDDAGELVAVYPDGATKAIGAVRGKDGKPGASVMDGRVDDAGQLVLRMSDGRSINAGTVRGKDGVDAQGEPGKPGRDALEVRVLPGIDESKGYPEGTCALYRGGMIRAERATDPIDGDLKAAGWRVALEGIAEEDENEIDDGRMIERKTTYTSGRTFTRTITTAAMVYRGVFKAGTEYERGDTATWDGSTWHCERATKAEPGNNGGDWKLMAKRGAPGRDALPVKGEPGPPGRPGRDLTQLGPNGSKF